MRAVGPVARKRARWGLTVILALGVVLAVIRATDEADRIPWPSGARVAICFGLVCATLVIAAASWSALLNVHGERSRLARTFLYSQLGKYVPGGVFQIGSQFDGARRSGVERQVAAVALPVHALVATVVPGGVAAIVLAASSSSAPTLLRFALAAGGGVIVALLPRRESVRQVLDRAHRRWPRIPHGGAIPPQISITRAALLGCVASLCFGSGYAALVPVSDPRDVVILAAGFLVAFTVGFLALPFPSGLGVREGVLVILLRPVADGAVVLSAAVVIRLIQLAAELTLVILAVAAARLTRRDTRTV